MGWGSWALTVKAMGVESYGSELSQERIDYAASNGIKISSWDDIPGADFDFINTEQVFEHIAEPLEVLLHLKKGLKPDGVIKISVPTATNIDKRLAKMDWHAPRKSKFSLSPIAPLEHINYFRKQSLLSMADQAGMEPINHLGSNRHLFSPLSKLVGQWLKELIAPKKKNKNYLFFKMK